MLEYNSNFWRNVPATLLGASGTGIVVVGPLKHASDSSRIFIVASGMYDLSFLPFLSHCSEPASQRIISDWYFLSFKALIIESTPSGPFPSPLITAAFWLRVLKECNPQSEIILCD